MKTTPGILTAAILLCPILFAWPAAAQNTVSAQFLTQDPADLTALVLTPSSITISGSPDQYQLTFSETLLNTDVTDQFLNGGNLSFTGNGFDQDASPFAAFPISLASLASSSGPVFTLTETGLVSPGTYFGSFSILGGSDADTYDPLAVQPFEVQVTAPLAVPETSTVVSLGLLLTLGGTGLWFAKRRTEAAR